MAIEVDKTDETLQLSLRGLEKMAAAFREVEISCTCGTGYRSGMVFRFIIITGTPITSGLVGYHMQG